MDAQKDVGYYRSIYWGVAGVTTTTTITISTL
jgi:hypothetical protein